MRERRYILHPGQVISASDHDHHYVGARRLADLYRVPWHLCVLEGPGVGHLDTDIHLFPRDDGNYDLARLTGKA